MPRLTTTNPVVFVWNTTVASPHRGILHPVPGSADAPALGEFVCVWENEGGAL